MKTRVRKVHRQLPKPNRPNDFQQLVLRCRANGMQFEEISQVFGLGSTTVRNWRRQYANAASIPDKEYFIERARQLKVPEESIKEWFDL